MWNFEEAVGIWFVNDYARKAHYEHCQERADQGATVITHEFDRFWRDERTDLATYDALRVINWMTKVIIRRYTMDEIDLANQDYRDNNWEHADCQMPY